MAERENRNLPSGWIWIKLEDCVDILDNLRIPVNQQDREQRIKEKNQQELYPYYGATGLVGYIDDYLFDGEYLLIGEDGAPFFDASKSVAYVLNGKIWVNNHAHVLKAIDGLTLNKYLGHYINTFDFTGYVTGTTRLKLNQFNMKLIPVPLAPLAEQKRIVEEIEAQFSRLDSWLDIMYRLLDELPRLRASILKAAVEGRLVPQNPDDEPADILLQRILDERRRQWEENYLAELEAKGKPAPKNDKWKEKYKEPESPNLDGLPELPSGWVWASVEQLADVKTGATPLTSNYAYYNEGAIPWVTSSAVNDPFIYSASEYITELALKETNAKIFPIGTLVIAMYGEGKTRGNISELRIEAATNQACAALVLNDIASDCRDFIKRFFQKNYDELRSLASGGTQPNLNLGIIKSTILPLPPLQEQRQITKDLDYRFSILDQLAEMVERNIKRAEKMRQSVLKQAFEGKLVEQDPDDEPASELLERIRIERERRAEEQKKNKPKGKKGEAKVTTKTEQKSLYDTLKDVERPLQIAELFHLSGFFPETIDDFYEELKKIEDMVEFLQQNDYDVLVKVKS